MPPGLELYSLTLLGWLYTSHLLCRPRCPTGRRPPRATMVLLTESSTPQARPSQPPESSASSFDPTAAL